MGNGNAGHVLTHLEDGLDANGGDERSRPRRRDKSRGQVGAGQSPPAGGYSDTVVVTVNF